MRPVVLSIAGSDSCGGAGIQADLAACCAFGVRGATAITAITAQNSAGVRAVQAVPAALVRAQVDAVFEGGAVHAVKLGMLAEAPIIAAVAAALQAYAPRNVVIDPMMVATSGARLLQEEAVTLLRTQLLAQADCLTPNLDEAAALLDAPLAQDEVQMVEQGRALLALGARAVLMKGGHAPLAQAVDLLVQVDRVQRYVAPWVQGADTHGSGCTLSAAIVASLAKGLSLTDAVAQAKQHLGDWLQTRITST